jgi:uncharacterized membrane protein
MIERVLDHDTAIKSYRYLRLALVIIVLSLGVSLLLERWHAGCWSTSISASYYTPVRSVFVGGLVAIGVCLITIRGRTDPEDILLNIAGMLAPIVAFVPTSPPHTVCSSVPYLVTDARPFIDNNLLSLAIGGMLAMGVAYVSARRHGPVSMSVSVADRIGYGIALLIILSGLVWYVVDRDDFVEFAHGYAALALFVAIGIVVWINRRHARPKFARLYGMIAGFMVLAAVAVGIGTAVADEWNHSTLWIEALEIGAFAVFWTLQTFEHWGSGVAPPS